MKLIACVLLVLALFFSLYSHAHPHNWIDLQTEFTLDKNGQLKELTQHWTFDIYYSAIRLADLANEYQSQQLGLKFMANDMAKNLHDFQYFSELKINNESIDLPRPSYSSVATVTGDEQEQLILTMHFVLEKPLPLKNRTLSWRVFDPTYYIEMKHHSLSQIYIKSLQSKKCLTEIKSPKPSAELIRYATELDRKQTDTKGLGTHFAETVLVQCS